VANRNTPFDPLSVPCTCEGVGDERAYCPCSQAGGAERVLRFVMAVDGRLDAQQREYCLAEIDKVEGHSRKDFEGASDADIARGTIEAWMDYCHDKGLL